MKFDPVVLVGKKIVINFRFGIFLPGFQDRFHHENEIFSVECFRNISVVLKFCDFY